MVISAFSAANQGKIMEALILQSTNSQRVNSKKIGEVSEYGDEEPTCFSHLD